MVAGGTCPDDRKKAYHPTNNITKQKKKEQNNLGLSGIMSIYGDVAGGVGGFIVS